MMKFLSGFSLLWGAYVLTVVMPGISLAASIQVQKFGRPLVCQDRIIFTSIDKLILKCIDLRGTIIWEKKYSKPIMANPRNEKSIMIQVGKRVSIVDATTGMETFLFQTRTKYEVVHFDRRASLMYSIDDRKKYRQFRVLNAKSGAILWENPNIESLSLALKDIVICVTGQRVYNKGGGYLLTNTAAEAYDRMSGRQLWRLELSANQNTSWLQSVHLRPYIVILDGDAKLVCVDVRNGQIVRAIGKSSDFSNKIAHITAKDNLLVYITHKTNFDDFSKTQHFLHFSLLPDFKERSTMMLMLNEIARFEFYKEYIITDAFYTTACFNAKNAQKIWQKHQMDMSKPDKGKIYFSDNLDGKITRIGVVDIASGEITVLYKKKIK